MGNINKSIYPQPEGWVKDSLLDGQVIPAHPLALTTERKIDERRQRALTRYYHASGAGGLAVAVHTTQFEIREPEHNLLRPVLELAATTVRECDEQTGRRTVLIAGACGETTQAIEEAILARELGYHAVLLSLAALKDANDETLIEHCLHIAAEIPLIGFYLQPAVGGRKLSYNFWRRFAEIPNVIAIKIAPFNRYYTFDVLRAVAESSRANEIALYTGNDDHIVLDLLTNHIIPTSQGEISLWINGGLLGHWACWTRKAVELLDRCKAERSQETISTEMLSLAIQVSDCNAAIFDVANDYAGVIAGIHEVLYQQGLLTNTLCLNPEERLSPDQADAIERVRKIYPHLIDDDFITENLHEWLQ